jgi:hypothetical protein
MTKKILRRKQIREFLLSCRQISHRLNEYVRQTKELNINQTQLVTPKYWKYWKQGQLLASYKITGYDIQIITSMHVTWSYATYEYERNPLPL